MHPATDSFFFQVVLLGILFAGFLRLDEAIAQPARQASPKNFRPGSDLSGHAMSDPDGRPWSRALARSIRSSEENQKPPTI